MTENPAQHKTKRRARPMKFAVVALVLCLPLVLYPRIGIAFFFGWIHFLSNAAQHISINWNSVITATVALVLFTVGTHFFIGPLYLEMRTTTSDEQPAHRWKPGWSLALTMLMILMFCAGISMVGIVHQIAWLRSSDESIYTFSAKKLFIVDTKDNLKKAGVAILNHSEVHGAFPPGGTRDKQGRMQHSWMSFILNIDTDRYVVEFYRDVAWDHPANDDSFKTIHPEFINTNVRTDSLFDENGYGLSHYAANVHLMGINRGYKTVGKKDRISNMLVIGEINANFKPWGDPSNMRDPLLGLNTSPDGFGSPSPGGVHFLLGDGSVRFISNQIDASALQAMSKPKDADQADSYREWPWER